MTRIDEWQENPVLSFEKFIASDEYMASTRRRAEQGGAGYTLGVSSQRIYINMFGKFIRWIGMNGLSLMTVSENDISLFLEKGHAANSKQQKYMASSIRVRYLRLLERVFSHLEVAPNPAEQAMMHIDPSQSGHDKPKVVLTERQFEQFVAALPDVPIFDASKTDRSANWKTRRDNAMLMMMLAGGLTVSEVIELETKAVGSINRNGEMPVGVKASGLSKEHNTFIKAYALPTIMAWIHERTVRQIPGQYLFPPTLLGMTKTGGKLLNKSTVYRHARVVFELAQIPIQRQGGRTLRNTFAIRELENGKTLEDLQYEMGHRTLKATYSYLPRENSITSFRRSAEYKEKRGR